MKHNLLFVFLLFSISAFGQTVQQPSSEVPETKLIGCSLVSEESIDFLGRMVLEGSGNRSLDLSIQTDVLELQKVFGVSAKMFLFQEVNNPNAFALNEPLMQIMKQFRVPPNTSPDGMVFLGINLMRSEYRSGAGTGYSIPSIIAHEYAHILQYKLNSGLEGKWRELQADYLAGWYTAHRSRYISQNIDESTLSFFKKGDYDFNAPQHHGLPQERLQAFIAGLNLNFRGNIKFARIAYAKSLIYLQQRIIEE